MISEPRLPLSPETPLAPAVRLWAQYLQREGRSPHTVRGFVSDLRLLVRYLSPDRPLGRIHQRDLENFLNWLQYQRGVPCSPKSLARRITSLKAFFRWLHRYGVLPGNPAERLVHRSVATRPPRVLTPTQVEQVLDRARSWRRASRPDVRPLVLFLLLYTTGMKKGEVLNLRLRHLALELPQPILYVRYPSPSYRYKERRLPLPDAWVRLFEEYRQQYAIHDRVFPWSARALEYVLEGLGRAAGLPFRLSFAICRWTASLRDWRSGMDPEQLREKLGLSPVQWRDVARKLVMLDHQLPPEPAYPDPWSWTA